MKKSLIAILILFCFSLSFYAQDTTNKAIELKNQAISSLKQKDYTKARYLYKRAYEAFAAQGNLTQAIECGVKTSELYARENYYKEAFDMCRDMEGVILKAEQVQNKPLYALRFPINNERMRMYITLKKPAQALDQLNKLEGLATQAKSDSLMDVLLYTKADYYYTFNQNTLGDASFNKLISRYKANKDYDKVSDCYKDLINVARKENNAPLMQRTYESYIVWTDSVRALTAQDELNVLKRKYDDSQNTLQQKESTISTKQYIIIGLCTALAIAAAGIIVLFILLLKFMAGNRKLKKNIAIANENNGLKTQFIENISKQMEPTLNSLDASAKELIDKAPQEAGKMEMQVMGLKKFSDDIQELSSLENSLSVPYDNTEFNAGTFSEMIMDRAKGHFNKEVTSSVNAPKLQIKANKEQLERVLLHLLKNATYYTEKGHISLDFKKRAAHTMQFIVTDTGTGIPADKQEAIFKPFSQVNDLTTGDGLGLPICALIAEKMNGSLTVDKSYTKGARFILEIRS